MPRTVRQSRHFIIRPETSVRDYLPRRSIDNLTWSSNFGGSKSCILRLTLEVPNIALALGRFAKYEGAGDIRLVAVNTTATVHEHDITLTQFLRCAAPVGKGGVFPEADKNTTHYTQTVKSRLTVIGKLTLRHSFSHAVVCSFVSSDGNVVCALHQGKFCW